jgi:hypothetical protein
MKDNVYVKIPLAVVDVIWKSYVLLRIGATDQIHSTHGSKATLRVRPEHPIVFKSNVQVRCYNFCTKS